MDKDKMKEKLMKLKPGKLHIPNKGSSSGTQSGGRPDQEMKQSSFDSGNR